jgi:hypothetical protein
LQKGQIPLEEFALLKNDITGSELTVKMLEADIHNGLFSRSDKLSVARAMLGIGNLYRSG